MTDANNEHPLAVELAAVIANWRGASRAARRVEREAKLRADEYDNLASELKALLARCPTTEVVTCGACGRLSPPPDEHVCAQCDDEQQGAPAPSPAPPPPLWAADLERAYAALRWCAARRVGPPPPLVQEAFARARAHAAQEQDDD